MPEFKEEYRDFICLLIPPQTQNLTSQVSNVFCFAWPRCIASGDYDDALALEVGAVEQMYYVIAQYVAAEKKIRTRKLLQILDTTNNTNYSRKAHEMSYHSRITFEIGKPHLGQNPQ